MHSVLEKNGTPIQYHRSGWKCRENINAKGRISDIFYFLLLSNFITIFLLFFIENGKRVIFELSVSITVIISRDFCIVVIRRSCPEEKCCLGSYWLRSNRLGASINGETWIKIFARIPVSNFMFRKIIWNFNLGMC